MAYCPNCAKAVEDEVKNCVGCGADFSTGSAWKPVSEPPRRQPLGSRRNVIISAVAFTTLFPPVGALAWMLSEGGSLWPPFVFVGMLASYGLVGKQALLAGFSFFSALELIVRIARPKRIPLLVYLACGVGAAAVSWLDPYAPILLNNLGGSKIMMLSLAVGAFLALICFHYWPAGNES